MGAGDSSVRRTKRASATNRLLAGLPRKSYQHVLAECESVELVSASVLYEPGGNIGHVYFPTDSFIALVSATDGNCGLAVSMVGNEGMVGIPLMLGSDVSPLFALVQGGGPTLRMTAATFRRELALSSPFQQQLNRYLDVFTVQLARTTACVHYHLLEARLARWLLMMRDRANSNEFRATHDVLASMLGVRRVGVTKAAHSLQKRKLISYTRGGVTIVDHGGLEAVSCRCYCADTETYDRVLG
jgi:CRP-like cAMP-binding protein